MSSSLDSKRRYMKPWIFGAAAGSLIVAAEAVLGLYPPSAYAFCLACHTRDLVNTILNAAARLNFETTDLAKRMLMLTSPAVLIGAYIAARRHGESVKQKSRNPIFSFSAGFIIMIAGILIFGCPTRIVIRVGYGELYGIVAFFGMTAGIWLGSRALRYISVRKG